MRDALLIVGVQRDFMPGGPMEVAGGDRIIPKVNDLIRHYTSQRRPVFLVKDWHPEDHLSFLSQGGPWPSHCVAGTAGAELAEGLLVPEGVEVITRGVRPDFEAFSGFRGTDLGDRISHARVDRVTVAGTSTDGRVLFTVRDAFRHGLKVRVVSDATRAGDASSVTEETSLGEMKKLGAQVASTQEILSEPAAVVPSGSIEPFIHRKIVILFETDSVEKAAKAMETHGIGSVLVCSSSGEAKGRVTGIVTDRDLACRVLAKGRGPDVALSEVMTRNPVVVSESAALAQAIALMEEHGIRRIPVIRELPSGKTRGTGMISFDDLIASGEAGGLHPMRIVRAQLLRRMMRSSGYQQWLEQLQVKAFPREETGAKAPESLVQAVANSTGLSPEQAGIVLRAVLTALMRRLHRSAAMSLAANLPEELQLELSRIPAGPNHSVTVQNLVTEVLQTLNVPVTEAQSLVYRACRTLQAWIGPERFHHVRDQLPGDFKMLFGRREPKGAAA